MTKIIGIDIIAISCNESSKLGKMQMMIAEHTHAAPITFLISLDKPNIDILPLTRLKKRSIK